MTLRFATFSRSKRLGADLVLLIVAVVWGSAFVAQRAAAAHLGFFLYNGLRFVLGGLTLWPVVRGRGRTTTRLEWQGGILAGLLLVGASAFQQAGLQFTTAGKAGFITGLYVVLVPLFLALGWRQRWGACHRWVDEGRPSQEQQAWPYLPVVGYPHPCLPLEQALSDPAPDVSGRHQGHASRHAPGTTWRQWRSYACAR